MHLNESLIPDTSFVTHHFAGLAPSQRSSYVWHYDNYSLLQILTWSRQSCFINNLNSYGNLTKIVNITY